MAKKACWYSNHRCHDTTASHNWKRILNGKKLKTQYEKKRKTMTLLPVIQWNYLACFGYVRLKKKHVMSLRSSAQCCVHWPATSEGPPGHLSENKRQIIFLLGFLSFGFKNLKSQREMTVSWGKKSIFFITSLSPSCLLLAPWTKHCFFPLNSRNAIHFTHYETFSSAHKVFCPPLP